MGKTKISDKQWILHVPSDLNGIASYTSGSGDKPTKNVKKKVAKQTNLDKEDISMELAGTASLRPVF